MRLQRQTGAPVSIDSWDGIPVVFRNAPAAEWLYRFYGEENLLYAGITRKGATRFEGHRKDKAWWPHVRRIEVECFPDRSAACLAEINAIEAEQPCFNVADRGAYAAQAARYNEAHRKVLRELNEVRSRVAELERETAELRAALRGEAPDWMRLVEHEAENVITLVPLHLRPGEAA